MLWRRRLDLGRFPVVTGFCWIFDGSARSKIKPEERYGRRKEVGEGIHPPPAEDAHVNDEGTMGVDTSELQNLFSGLALFDLHFTGHFHTWCNQRMGPARIYCKLYRAIVNALRLSSFPLSCALFLNKGVSDHSPCLVKITNDPWEGPRPFRFCDMWKTDPSYMQLVSSAWRDTIQGHPMYILVNRLKKTKNALSDLHIYLSTFST